MTSTTKWFLLSLVPLLRDMVWVIPIGILLLVVLGPVPMIIFALVGGTIRALTFNIEVPKKRKLGRNNAEKRTIAVVLLVCVGMLPSFPV